MKRAGGRLPRIPLAWRIGLGGIALLVLGLVLSAQPFARWQTRRTLSRLEGVESDFSDVSVGWVPLTYRITHLRLNPTNRRTKEPLFYAESLTVELDWRNVISRHRTARVSGQGVKVVLEQPESRKHSSLPTLEEALPISMIFTRVDVHEGEVLYAWVHQRGRPTLWFHGIEGTLKNLATRPGLQEGETTLVAQGQVEKQGRMSADVQVSVFAERPTFTTRVSLQGFEISSLNALIDSQKNVKLSPGIYDTRMELVSKQGRVTGWVAPSLTATGIVASDAGVFSAFKALLAKASMTLSEPAEGTTSGGRIRVRDELAKDRRPLVLTLEKVVENGFLLGMQEGLKRVYTHAAQTPSDARAGVTDLRTDGVGGSGSADRGSRRTAERAGRP